MKAINFNGGENIPNIDTWNPEPQDIIFTNAKGFIICPVTDCFNIKKEEDDTLDYFYVAPKKCYNSKKMRAHMCQYLNYFEKFFDPDKELLVTMAKVKYMIDCIPEYTNQNFLYDMRVYILNESLINKAIRLVECNYTLDLSYKQIADSLQYTNEHAKIMLCMSILMNFTIPLITHFAYTHRIGEIDDTIMEVFDIILHLFSVDIYTKLYETAISNVGKSQHRNAPLWAKQDIRGRDVVTHSYSAVSNIVLNIMPKYTFDRNIVALNYTSIQKSTGHQITDISYEFNYISLSSSKRDEDNVSDFDKFESNLIKQNEALFLQMQCNSSETMKSIEAQFGPFDMEEVMFYKEQLSGHKGHPVQNFQKYLIFNLFYKYFGDTSSIYAINAIDYIKLMIAAKKILKGNYMILLPYILSAKVEKYVSRKTVNKKELIKVKASPYYNMVYEKYQNDKIINQILSTIATIISSDFRIIDYHDKSLHGKMIDTMPDLIVEEVLAYVMLI